MKLITPILLLVALCLPTTALSVSFADDDAGSADPSGYSSAWQATGPPATATPITGPTVASVDVMTVAARFAIKFASSGLLTAAPNVPGVAPGTVRTH